MQDWYIKLGSGVDRGKLLEASERLDEETFAQHNQAWLTAWGWGLSEQQIE